MLFRSASARVDPALAAALASAGSSNSNNNNFNSNASASTSSTSSSVGGKLTVGSAQAAKLDHWASVGAWGGGLTAHPLERERLSWGAVVVGVRRQEHWDRVTYGIKGGGSTGSGSGSSSSKSANAE